MSGTTLRPETPCAGGRPIRIERRWHQVDHPHRVGHAPAPGRVERRADDQRHPRRSLVNEEAVRILTVIAKALAVVAENRDDGVLEQAARLEKLDDAAHL